MAQAHKNGAEWLFQLNDDAQLLEDMILTAANQALRQAERLSRAPCTASSIGSSVNESIATR